MTDDHAIEAAGRAVDEATDARIFNLAEVATAAIRAYLAAMEAEAVMVPREPTEAMIVAGIAERHDAGVPEAWSLATANIYLAMLAARPKIGEG